MMPGKGTTMPHLADLRRQAGYRANLQLVLGRAECRVLPHPYRESRIPNPLPLPVWIQTRCDSLGYDLDERALS